MESVHGGSRSISPPIIDSSIPIWFFDGGAQEDGSKCGAGAIIQLENNQKYIVSWNCCKETNTRGELLALWVMLWTAKLFHILNMQILGDPKVIVH